MSSIPDLPLEPFYQPVCCGCLPLFLQAITLLSNADKQCLLSYRSEFETAFKRLQQLQIWLCSVPSDTQPNTAPGSDTPEPAQSKTPNTSPLETQTTTAPSNSLAPPAIPANASAPSDTAPPPDDAPTLAPPAPPAPAPPAPAPPASAPPAPAPAPAPAPNTPAPVSHTPGPVSDIPTLVSDIPTLVSDIPTLVSDIPTPVSDIPTPVSDAPAPIPAPAPVSDAPAPIPTPTPVSNAVSDGPLYIPIASEPASVVSDTTEDLVTKLIHLLEKSKQAILDCQDAAPVIATRLGREDPRVAKIYMSQNESNMSFESFLCSISLADDYTDWETSKSYPGRLAALYKDVNVSKNRKTAYYKEYVKSCEHIIDKATARNGVEYGVRFRFLEMEYSRRAGKPYVPNEHLGIIGIVSFATRCFLRLQYQDLPRLADGLLSSSDLANLAEERNDWINQNLQRIKTGTSPPMETETIPAETIPAETPSTANASAETQVETPVETPVETRVDIGLTDPPASTAETPSTANASADTPVETSVETPADTGLTDLPASPAETPSESDIPATFMTRKRTLVDETVQRQSKNPRLDLDVNFNSVGNSCFPGTLDIDQDVAVNIDHYFPDPDLTINAMGESCFPDPNSVFTINPMGESRFPDFDTDLTINPMGESRFPDPNSVSTINPMGESRFPGFDTDLTINPMGESRFPDPNSVSTINPMGESRFPGFDTDLTIDSMGESHLPDFDPDLSDFIPEAPDLSGLTINPMGESRFLDQYRDINFNPGMQTLVENIC